MVLVEEHRPTGQRHVGECSAGTSRANSIAIEIVPQRAAEIADPLFIGEVVSRQHHAIEHVDCKSAPGRRVRPIVRVGHLCDHLPSARHTDDRVTAICIRDRVWLERRQQSVFVQIDKDVPATQAWLSRQSRDRINRAHAVAIDVIEDRAADVARFRSEVGEVHNRHIARRDGHMDLRIESERRLEGRLQHLADVLAARCDAQE